MMNPNNMSFFQGFTQDILDEIRHHLKLRCYQSDEFICRQGEVGDSMFIIESGLVEILIQQPDSLVLLDRLRRGDILGEMALLTGEPRTANAVAAAPTEVMELNRNAFAAIIAHYPHVLFNISQILIQRQKRNHAVLSQHHHRGEAVAIVVGRKANAVVAAVIAAIQSADPNNTVVIDLTRLLPVTQLSVANQSITTVFDRLDRLLANYETVITVVDAHSPDLHLLIRHMDRIELIAALPEALYLHRKFKGAVKRFNCILIGDSSLRDRPEDFPDIPVLRTLPVTASPHEIAWLARHLRRKKVGLALGAGGARGFAHIGVLSVLEQAGIPIDYIAGSSIGAMVGSFLAMGMNAATIAEQLKGIWSAETVAELNVFSQEGHSVGLQTVMKAAAAVTGELTFAHLGIPLTIMTADLNTQQAAPMNEGSLAEALCAGISVPGMVPPYVRGSQRLVDGIAIVPVPTAAVKNAGADIIIAVNLLHRDTLTAWPAETPPPPAANPKSSKTLDPVLETLIMLQLDTSVRHAAEADLVINPWFPSLSWRDYHLADLIHHAGQQAAQEQLPGLLNLIRP